MSESRRQGPPIACNLTVEEQTERHREVSEQVCAHVLETEELEDGYAYRFPGNEELLQVLNEFVLFERKCCPFLTFELVFEPETGPATLRMRGPNGTKAFLQGGLALFR